MRLRDVVRRHRRDDEGAPRTVAEAVGQRDGLLGEVRRGVDRGIEGPAVEHRQVAVAIEVQVLGLGERVDVARPPVQQCHGVPPCERRGDDVPPDEPGTAHDQDPHVASRWSACSW